MTLGEKLSERRKRLGYTQDAVAERLGVTPQAVSKWENDVSCPDISLLPKIARLYETSIDELLSEKSEPIAYVAPENERKSIDDMVLRINVNDSGDKVKINLPLVLLRAMVSSNPDNVNINLGKGNFSVDWKMIISLIENGAIGRLLELEGGEGETVVIEVI